MKILIIGGGNMGMTYAKSFLHTHSVDKGNMLILEKSPEKAISLQNAGLGTVSSDPSKCLPPAELIILAVKPQDIDTLFPVIRPFVNPQQLFLSIMAGVPMQRIGQALGVQKIIRAMPNLPAQIGKGMTGYTATSEVSRSELIMAQNLLNTTGKTIYLDKENLLDAVTAISGSGPAYVWFFMQAMIDAAQKMGFTPAQAELLVGQTYAGAIELLQKQDFTCSEWIEKVCSKGGTTEAALGSFEKSSTAISIQRGMEAAWKRAEELGRE